MRNIVRNNRGQFVIIAALLIAALTLATAISIHEITINRQSISYKPAGEFLLGTTSDMNRALTVSLAKYTSEIHNNNDQVNAGKIASNFMSTWKQSLLTSYSSYGIKIRTDLSQNMIPNFQTNWIGNGVSSSFAYIPYAFDVESYGFMGWTGATAKYVQLQITSVNVENWPSGTTDIDFQLMQSDVNLNNPSPISDLPTNPDSSNFHIGAYNDNTKEFTLYTGPVALTYLGEGKYHVTFNQAVDPINKGVKLEIATPNDGIWVSNFNYDYTKASTTTHTLLSAASGSITLGDSVTDSVTVTGLGDGFPIPSGPVTFQVSTDGGSTWNTFGSTKTLSSGSATSDSYTPLAIGNYNFRAVYGGDNDYLTSQSANTEEPLTVNKFTPTVSTQLSATTITLGQNVSDTATVTSLDSRFSASTGTVNFQVSTDSSSTWTQFGSAKALNSSGRASSDIYIPSSAGAYYFRAVYSGDNNYTASQSGIKEEPLTVNKAATVTSTVLSSTTILVGQSVTDNATVKGNVGGPAPTGSVTFQVSSDKAATWTTFASKTLSAAGSVVSDSYKPEFAGLYYFRAVYSGDSNYVGSQSGLTEEPLPVTSGATPSNTTTLLSASSIPIGKSITDSANVTGIGGVPSGAVRFEVKAVGSSAWIQFGSEKTLNSSGLATSDSYMPLFAGTYYFRAVYGGDSVFSNSVSNDTDEPLAIVAGTTTSTTTTQLSSDKIQVGNSVTDSATVTGVGGTPSGSVLFQVSVSGSSTWTTFSTKTLSSGSATSDPYTPSSAGAYNFRARYSGDATYTNSTSGDSEEPLTVTSGSAASTTTTLLSESNIIVNNAVTDNVTVTGKSGTPTGFVTFEVQAPGSSTWTQFGSVKTLDSDGKATSDSFIPSSTGIYHFRAHYGGSGVYAVSVSGDSEEPLTVAALKSTTRTILSKSSVTYSQSVTDSAIVSGSGLTPTGTVAFQVQIPGSSVWTQFGSNKTLDNTGHVTSDSYTPQAAGTFYFRAVYYGDETYAASTSGDTEEPLQAIPLTSTTTTLLAASTITLGQSTTDSVTVTGVTGGPAITGTVRFETMSPGSSSWVAFGSVKTLDNSGHATSDSYMPQAAGTHYFRAVYLGAGYYAGSQSGDTEEPLTVNKAASTTSTLLSQTTITFSQTITDTATVQGVTGCPTPTGTVTFQVSVNGGASWSQVGSAKTLSGGSATSDSYAPFSVGGYNFRAVYSGDSNYLGSHSGNAEEPLTVNMASGTSGNYILSSASQSGQNGFLTNSTTSLMNPYGKVNPQLSNGHETVAFSSDKPVPSMKTANTISLVYFLQTTQVSNQNWQTIQATLSFTYQGQSYTMGTAIFNATASKSNPPPLYYTLKIDVTGHTFIDGFPQQVIPAGSIITLTTTLINPNNRVDLYGGIAGTQIILF